MPSRRIPKRLAREFHRAYYDAAPQTWKQVHWLGYPVHKNPCDLWVYQELIHRVRPAVILETGTLYGGSALYFASLCDLLGHGHVLTIDREQRSDRPPHPRITYVLSPSTDPPVVAHVRALVADAAPVMVVLDSDHRAAHVTAELEAYAPLVSVGSYLVVEDTNLGHEVWLAFCPGPREALQAWHRQHPEFVVERQWERHGLTFQPGGWLRRVA